MTRKILGLIAFVATGVLMLITQWVSSQNFVTIENIVLLIITVFYAIGIIDHFRELKE